MNTPRLPAEWEEQDGVLLAWPHKDTAWRPYLPRVQETFSHILAEASHHGRIVLVCDAPGEARHALQQAGAVLDRILFCPVPCNDIWARDFGPITVIEHGKPVLLDFHFNGWGGKYPSDLDNVVSKEVREHGTFGATHLRSVHFVLEGGSIDSDGQGTLLTTASCNTNPNRNPHLSRQDVEQTFRQFLGAQRVLWLEHGYLAGDDTDGHVDMLARFAPHDTIVYQSCDNISDEHYIELATMAEELEAFRTLAGHPYRLLALPWPSAKFNENGARLPASYANFLVLNGVVLVPLYNDPRDTQALDIIARAFPGRKVVGIDCSTLIIQHGSLHCVTMQLPKGVLP